MATEILASGTSTASSSDVVLPDGSGAILSLFSAGELPPKGYAEIVMKTSGNSVHVAWLHAGEPVLRVEGGATYVLKRYAYSGTAFGACTGV